MDPTDDPYAGLPEDWSDSAKETYASIVDDSRPSPHAPPTLTAAALATLYEAASLIDLADRMQAQVDADGLMIDGSRSKVAHPLIAEARHARIGALAAIRGLGLGRTAASAAGAALVAHRHHGGGLRAIPGGRS